MSSFHTSALGPSPVLPPNRMMRPAPSPTSAGFDRADGLIPPGFTSRHVLLPTSSDHRSPCGHGPNPDEQPPNKIIRSDRASYTDSCKQRLSGFVSPATIGVQVLA